ncbi:MAG: hypothetical protein WCO33_05075 [bacterium]
MATSETSLNEARYDMYKEALAKPESYLTRRFPIMKAQRLAHIVGLMFNNRNSPIFSASFNSFEDDKVKDVARINRVIQKVHLKLATNQLPMRPVALFGGDRVIEGRTIQSIGIFNFASFDLEQLPSYYDKANENYKFFFRSLYMAILGKMVIDKTDRNGRAILNFQERDIKSNALSQAENITESFPTHEDYDFALDTIASVFRLHKHVHIVKVVTLSSK